MHSKVLIDDVKEKKLRKDNNDNLVKACRDLINTYDCNNIDNMGTVLREAFFELSEKTEQGACSGQSGKKVLKKLIHNHFNKDQLPTPAFIGGPTSLTVHYSYEYDMTVYIFGEFHGTKFDCKEVENPDSAKPKTNQTNTMPIEDFLEELLQKTNVYLDILFEIYPFDVEKGYKMQTSDLRMIKIHEKLNTCMHTKTREDEKCHLGRVHWIDIRKNTDGNMARVSQLFLTFCGIVNSFEKLEKSEENLLKEYNEFTKLISDYKDIFVDISNNCELMLHHDERLKIKKLTDYFKYLININPKIQRIDEKVTEQAEAGDDYNLQMFRKIYAIIIENLETKIKNYNTGDNKMYENIVKLAFYDFTYTPTAIPIKDIRDELHKIMLDVVTSLFTIDIFIMDLYAMFRVFKKYNTSKPAFNGAIPGDQPEKSHNVIIYAGECHSIHYRNILRKLNFVRKEETGGLKPLRSCISTEKIKMPFFQKNILLGDGMGGTNIRIANSVKPKMDITPLPSSLPWGDFSELPTPPVFTHESIPDIDPDKEYIDSEQIKKRNEENQMDKEHEEEEDEYDNMELVNYYKMENLNIDNVFEKELVLFDDMEPEYEIDDMICDMPHK